MNEELSVATGSADEAPRVPLNSDVQEILSLIGDGVVSVDCDGRIILFNRAAESLFGYLSSELLGRPIEVLLPTRFHDLHREDIHGFISSALPERHSMGSGREVLGRHKSGREFAVEATLSTHWFAGQQTFTAVVRDVTDSRTAEQQRQLIAGEVAHRLHNTMAVVTSIVSLTARSAASLPDFVNSLMGRFAAVSRTNEALINGLTSEAALHDLLLSELTAFHRKDGRFTLTGPDVKIDGKLALNLALVFHELATNAAKYGALSNTDGTVHIDWRISSHDMPILELAWHEIGGPLVTAPKRYGFGSQLIARILDNYNGKTEMNYDPGGVLCTIVVPLPPH